MEIVAKGSFEMLVYCQTPDGQLFPLGKNYYEVDNTVVFFKAEGEAEEGICTVGDFLNRLCDNFYTHGEGDYSQINEDYEVAFSSQTDWQEFNELYSIVDIKDDDERIILSLRPYCEDDTLENVYELKFLTSNTSETLAFEAEVLELIKEKFPTIEFLRRSLIEDSLKKHF